MILIILIFAFNDSVAYGVNTTEGASFGLLVARKAPVPGQWQHYQVRLMENAQTESFGSRTSVIWELWWYLVDTTDALRI